MDLAGGVGQCAPHVDDVVHRIPAQRQHFLASESKPESEVDGDVPRVGPLDFLEDPASRRCIDHLEGWPILHRTVHELRRSDVLSDVVLGLGSAERLRENT
jgi:hypothetical protein